MYIKVTVKGYVFQINRNSKTGSWISCGDLIFSTFVEFYSFSEIKTCDLFKNVWLQMHKLKFKSLSDSSSLCRTAWTREIVSRGGYPLGLIEYMIERVYQVFCHLNYINLAFLGICINPKGYPPLTFHQPKFFGGYPPLTFHQPKFFVGYPPLTFHQPKGFLGGTHLWLFINPMVFWGYPPLTQVFANVASIWVSSNLADLHKCLNLNISQLAHFRYKDCWINSVLVNKRFVLLIKKLKYHINSNTTAQ